MLPFVKVLLHPIGSLVKQFQFSSNAAVGGAEHRTRIVFLDLQTSQPVQGFFQSLIYLSPGNKIDIRKRKSLSKKSQIPPFLCTILL